MLPTKCAIRLFLCCLEWVELQRKRIHFQFVNPVCKHCDESVFFWAVSISVVVSEAFSFLVLCLLPLSQKGQFSWILGKHIFSLISSRFWPRWQFLFHMLSFGYSALKPSPQYIRGEWNLIQSCHLWFESLLSFSIHLFCTPVREKIQILGK